MTSDIPTTRVCSKCGEEKPLTPEFWHRNAGRFRSSCKVCQNAAIRAWTEANQQRQIEYRRQRYISNRETILENNRQWREANADRVREHAAEYYELNKSRIDERNRRWYRDNIEHAKEKARQYRRKRGSVTNRKYNAEYYQKNRGRVREHIQRWESANSEHLQQKRREWRERNREHMREMVRLWAVANKEQRREYLREWRKANPELVKAIQMRRRARELSLPATLTADDWQYAKDYFNGCCAICGRQLKDLFGTHTAAADHWVPLSKGGGSTPGNIVPLCHGQDGCNNSKHDADPIVWLQKKHPKKWKQILARIQAYFESVKDQT